MYGTVVESSYGSCHTEGPRNTLQVRTFHRATAEKPHGVSSVYSGRETPSVPEVPSSLNVERLNTSDAVSCLRMEPVQLGGPGVGGREDVLRLDENLFDRLPLRARLQRAARLQKAPRDEVRLVIGGGGRERGGGEQRRNHWLRCTARS